MSEKNIKINHTAVSNSINKYRILMIVFITAAVCVMSAGIGTAAAPTLAGSYVTAGNAQGVAVSGSYAYVADHDNGLVIVNISNQTAPTLAGSCDTAGYAQGVAVSDSYAYIADESNGLVIVDIS
ncbi:MAG: hypothetical protein K8R17_07550, partial [Methanosarcinales archaeon]|nr:hypothetical protein [Methanosarcinales archaeon]